MHKAQAAKGEQAAHYGTACTHPAAQARPGASSVGQHLGWRWGHGCAFDYPAPGADAWRFAASAGCYQDRDTDPAAYSIAHPDAHLLSACLAFCPNGTYR